jgi:hypothetical protein
VRPGARDVSKSGAVLGERRLAKYGIATVLTGAVHATAAPWSTGVQVVDAKTHTSLGYVARTVSASVAQLMDLQGLVRIACCITHTTVRLAHARDWQTYPTTVSVR